MGTRRSKIMFADIEIYDFGRFIARFLVLDVFAWYGATGQLHSFMRLYKPHTIVDKNVLCHTTAVVNYINLPRSRGISAY